MKWIVPQAILFLCIAMGTTIAGERAVISNRDKLALQLGQAMDSSLIVKCGLPLVAFLSDRGDTIADGLSSMLLRPVTQKSILRGRFRIFYDTTGMQAPAMLNANYQHIPNSSDEFADSVAAIANYVHDVETNPSGLAYPAPPTDFGGGGGDEYDIYVQELGNLYGYTTPETQFDGRKYSTFITIDNDFIFVSPDTNKGIPALKVTMAHEFHHAIQIGNYAYWGFDDIYYYEMTSVWMEDVVFTGINDYYNYLRAGSGHFRNPDVPLTSTELIMYSRGIWCHYLAKRNGREMVRRSWEYIASSRPLEALQAALSEFSSDVRSAFSEWALWGHFTGTRADTSYYPEAFFYPLMNEQVIGFSPPSRTVADSLGPLTSQYYQVLYNADTLTLVLSNLNYTAALTNPSALFGYKYLLNVSRLDETYAPTASGIFVKLETFDPTNWFSWNVVNGGVAPSNIRNGLAFPNPFITNGTASLAISTDATSPISGLLTIFSTNMERVYCAALNSTLRFGKNVFVWNGKGENNEPVQSGVYLWFLELPGQTLTGKIAVVHK